MHDSEIPILKKAYDLYKVFHEYRRNIEKISRHTIYERAESVILAVIELLFAAGYGRTPDKVALLEKASVKLNLLRLLVRLMKDTKTLQAKQYVTLQQIIDEIGRMLGGWIRSSRST